MRLLRTVLFMLELNSVIKDTFKYGKKYVVIILQIFHYPRAQW